MVKPWFYHWQIVVDHGCWPWSTVEKTWLTMVWLWSWHRGSPLFSFVETQQFIVEDNLTRDLVPFHCCSLGNKEERGKNKNKKRVSVVSHTLTKTVHAGFVTSVTEAKHPWPFKTVWFILFDLQVRGSQEIKTTVKLHTHWGRLKEASASRNTVHNDKIRRKRVGKIRCYSKSLAMRCCQVPCLIFFFSLSAESKPT